jgi:hypothetical protein
MAGQSGDEHEDEHGADQEGADGTPHPAPTVRATTGVAAPGHTPGELTDADDPHGPGPAPGRQAPDMAVYRGEPARRGPALAVLAPLLAAAGRGHRGSRSTVRSTRP